MNVKESILAAGVVLLKDKGIAALTQPQVARAAGVKQSHLTYYFPTRANLLLAIAEQWITSAMAEVAERLGEKPEQADLASTLAEVMIHGIQPRVIIGLIVAADAEPEIRESLGKFIAFVRACMQRFVTQVGLSGSPDQALLLHATVVGLAVMHQARLSPESVREVKDGVLALMQLLTPTNQSIETGAVT